MSENKENGSCSEALMQALEEVDRAESVLIIVRHKNNEEDSVSWHGYPNSNIERLGMLEFVRNAIVHRMFKD
jgi:hypothetical protein